MKTYILGLIFLCINTIGLSGQSSDSLITYWYDLHENYLEKNEVDSAIIALEQVCKYAKQTKDWDNLASGYLDIGFLWMNEGDLDSASIYYTYCIKTATNHDPENYEVLVNAHHLQGVVQYYLEDYNEAIYHTQLALKYGKLLGEDISTIIYYLNNIASFYLSKADYSHALSYYLEAKTLSNNIGEIDPILDQNIAMCYNYQNKNVIAINYINKARDEVPINAENADFLIELENNTATIYRELEQLDRAKEHLQTALTIQEQFDTENYITYLNLGYLYKLQNNKELAKTYLEQTFTFSEVSRIDSSKIYLYLGQILHDDTHYEQALTHYQKGIALLVSDVDTNSVQNPNIDQYIFSERNLFKLLEAKAKTLGALGKIDEALTTYQLGAELIVRMQQGYIDEQTQLFLSETTAPYYEAAFLLAKQAYEQTQNDTYLTYAFRFADATKSKLLYSTATKQHDKDSVWLKEKDLYLDKLFYRKKWFEAKAANDTDALLDYQEKMLAIDEDTQTLKKQTNSTAFALDSAFPSEDVITKIQHKLEDGHLFLEYFLCGEILYLFTIDNQTIELREVGNKVELETTMQGFYQGLLNPYTEELSSTAAYQKLTQNALTLYQKLMPSIAFSSSRISIIQEGALGWLPFSALLASDKDIDKQNYLNLDYALYHHTFDYAYSARLFLLESSTPTDNNTFVAYAPFANQFYKNLNRLHYSKNEVDNINTLMNGKVFENKEATIDTFLQYMDEDIIHIASHGILDGANAEKSYLVFDYAEELNVQQIQYLNINSKLVVLSACETAQGSFIAGEGVVSLGRAFLYAGAAGTVATLWKIRDKSSASIMQTFYEKLTEGKEVSLALQQAKCTYLEKDADSQTAHPYFWAAYTVAGDVAPIVKSNNAFFYWLIGGIIGLFAVFFWIFKGRRKEK